MKLPSTSLLVLFSSRQPNNVVASLRGGAQEDSTNGRAAAAGPHPLDRHLTEDGEEPWAALSTSTPKRSKLPGGGFQGPDGWALPDDSPDDTAADTSEISAGCTFEIVNGDLYEVCDNGLASLESGAPELAGNVVEAPGDLERQKNVWDFVSSFDGSYKTSSLYEL